MGRGWDRSALVDGAVANLSIPVSFCCYDFGFVDVSSTVANRTLSLFRTHMQYAGYIVSVQRTRLNVLHSPVDVDPGISRGVIDLYPSQGYSAPPVTRAIEASHAACKHEF